ncbi:MAG: hypothetical protein IPJ34_19690 [Myxococcales bacterium]|nr:hypothetical protein [Myxococcales bacterium]
MALSLLAALSTLACSSTDPPASTDDAATDAGTDAAVEVGADTSSPPDTTPVGDGGTTPVGDGGKTLESMTADEATALCRDAAAEAGKKLTDEQMKRVLCAFTGAFAAAGAADDASARAKCQAAYDDCMAKPAEDAGTPKDPCAGFATKAASCKGLTPAEYRAYMGEQTDILLRLADPKACSTVTASGTGPTLPTPATDVVQTKCPKLLSSG